MCGGDLKKSESYYLLKRSNYVSIQQFPALTLNLNFVLKGSLDSTRDISCADFTDAVESYMNDANTDPYALVLYLFKMKFGEDESLIYLTDVKAFLSEFTSYFEGDDLNCFVKDL